MKKDTSIIKKIEIYCCDSCDTPIQFIDSIGRTKWREKAFQCGELKNGAIGTWCSEECFEKAEKYKLIK